MAASAEVVVAYAPLVALPLAAAVGLSAAHAGALRGDDQAEFGHDDLHDVVHDGSHEDAHAGAVVELVLVPLLGAGEVVVQLPLVHRGVRGGVEPAVGLPLGRVGLQGDGEVLGECALLDGVFDQRDEDQVAIKL